MSADTGAGSGHLQMPRVNTLAGGSRQSSWLVRGAYRLGRDGHGGETNTELWS